MEVFGNTMTDLGWLIMPISFIAYFILNAALMLTNDLNVESIAIMILFFEAFDTNIDYFEEKRILKLNNEEDKRK